MLTPQDVHAVQFEKSFRGYRIEDVDRFLDRVEEQLKAGAAEADRLQRQIEQLQSENQRLAKETEDYRADGEIMKSALINAQRIGENVIREANQKAEEIIHKANLRSDDIIRDANDLLQKATDRADEIVREASDQRMLEEREYERVRLEVTRFKADVLNLYRSHVESLSRLPEYAPDAAVEPAAGEAEAGRRGGRSGRSRRGSRCCRCRRARGRRPGGGFLEQGRGRARRARPESARRGGLLRLPGRPVQQVKTLHPARKTARWGRAGAKSACPCLPVCRRAGRSP